MQLIRGTPLSSMPSTSAAKKCAPKGREGQLVFLEVLNRDGEARLAGLQEACVRTPLHTRSLLGKRCCF